MEDIVYFTYENLTYAKGFFNQNGHSFYVLPGFEEMFAEKVNRYLGPDIKYHLEVLNELPGPELCPPTVP
jgi:hypothetical protein